MSVTKHRDDAGDSRPIPYIVVRCNFCNKKIGQYEGSSKQIARRWAKQDGARLDNDLDFCDDNCYWKWEDLQTVRVTGTGVDQPKGVFKNAAGDVFDPEPENRGE